MAEKRSLRVQPQRAVKKLRIVYDKDDKRTKKKPVRGHSQRHHHGNDCRHGHGHDHQGNSSHGQGHEGHDHHPIWGEKEWNKYWSSEESKDDVSDEAHECLLKHKDILLQGRSQAKIFMPLCGASFDIKWLADLGHTVVGVEISEAAVKRFFEKVIKVYTVEEATYIKGKLYKTLDNQIRIYVCDFFKFGVKVESNFDAVWDSGAMHSLPKSQLQKYVNIVKPMMNKNGQYLVEFCVPSCSFDTVGKTDLEKYFGPKFKVRKLGLTKSRRTWYKKYGVDGFMVYHIAGK